MRAAEPPLPAFWSSSRRTPLAWRNVVHDKPTMLISSAAVAFAVLIMFMELGFLNGLYDSQTGLLRALNADLVMVSRGLHILNTHETFPRSRLQQVSGIDGVVGVSPVYLEDRVSLLRNPANGVTYGIRVIGFDVDAPAFENRRIADLCERLRLPMTVLFDRRSRSFFGPLNAGMQTELADRRITVAGVFDLGPDYYYDGNVLAGADTFFTLFPNQSRDQVAIGLIQLRANASESAVLRAIRAAVGPEVEVLTKAEITARERATWQRATPAGYIFTMGVAVGFVIGVFICYQILYTDIADHLSQLATLRAMGYQDRALVRLVLTQSALLGLFGFVPAVGVAFGLYAALTALTGIVTKLTLARVALIAFLTLGMCLVAGALALRKALTADPAELF
jgi:putative ABC transport system permease protein